MLSEEEKKTIDRLYIKAISYSVEAPDYPNTIVFKKDLVRILNLIEKQQKEIENLKEVNKEHQKLNGELREEIQRQGNTREIEEKYIEENFISKDKIRKFINTIRNRNYNDYTSTQDGNEVKEEIMSDLKELLKEE